MTTLVRVDNLSFRYVDSERWALAGVRPRDTGRRGGRPRRPERVRQVHAAQVHERPHPAHVFRRVPGCMTIDGGRGRQDADGRPRPEGRPALPEPGEPDIHVLGRRGTSPSAWRTWDSPGRDEAEGGRGHGPARDHPARAPRPARALRRSEAEGGPRRGPRHEAPAR